MEIIEELHLTVLSFVNTRPTGKNANSKPLHAASRCEQPSAAKNATEKCCKWEKKRITYAMTVTKKGIQFCKKFNTSFVFQVLKALVMTLLLNLYENFSVIVLLQYQSFVTTRVISEL